MSIDLAILKFFNVTLSCDALDIFFSTICDFKILAYPVGLIIITLLWKGGAKARWMIILVVAAVAIVDPTIYRILKPIFGRLRPCHNPAIDWLLTPDGCGGRYGFPSSHAANLMAVAIVVGRFYKNWMFPMLILALLVGIGRIYLGVHYPSDVLAGFAYGAFLAFVAIEIAKRRAPEIIGRFIRAKSKPERSENGQ